MKKDKGITLIALIITVIVLLILAGTAISIAINGGDIFGKASQAREEWNAAVANEKTKANNAIDILFGIDSTGQQIFLDGWDRTKISSVVSGTIKVGDAYVNVKAPIPIGYVASDIDGENTIDGGLVIYQGTDVVSNDDDAKTTRNQFVWIPVTDINSMIMCKENTAESVCNIVLEDDELVCKTHNNSTGASNFCGRLYSVIANSTNIGGKTVRYTSMNFEDNTQTYTQYSGNREPDIITGNANSISTNYDGDSRKYHGLDSAEAFLAQLQNDLYSMAKSVALYKGFYVGRYEAGYDTTTYTSKKGQNVMDETSEENKGANMWYGLYNHLRTSMGILNSQMIWGCQYDQIIKFIKQNINEGELDPERGHIDIRVNYGSNVSGADGSSDIMKNIYDLEGNYHEWTAEACNAGERANRGGDYFDTTNRRFYSASCHYSYNPCSTNTSYIGSRASLFL